jgi:hypothetical protein
MPDPGAFAYRTTKDGRVLISWNGRVVATLAGNEAAAFRAQVDGLDDRSAQLLMAARTGNFKRGNEGRQSPRNP